MIFVLFTIDRVCLTISQTNLSRSIFGNQNN